MKKLFWFIIIALVQAAWTESVASNQIRIVSTANVHGETDPCG